MSLAGIQATNVLPFDARQIFFHQRGQDVRQLGQALNSGDLAGAQRAYASLLALAQQNGGTSAASDAAAGLFHNPKVASDFAALGQALQAGDVAGAQQAFAAFRQDLRSGRNQNSSQQAANNRIPEIVINLSGILPSSTQPGATTSTLAPASAADASSSSSGSTSGTTGQASSTSSLPEIVLNLYGGNGSLAGPEIIFNFGNSAASPAPVPAPSSSDQQTTSASSQSPEIIFNLANSGVSEIDLNLGGSNPGLVLKFAPRPSSSGALNVVA